MRFAGRLLAVALLGLVGLANALPTPHARRTLVVVDESADDLDLTAEALAEPLRQRGHSVTAVGELRGHPPLFELGERQFDNVVIVPGATKGIGKGLTPKILVKFLESGGNIITSTTPRHSPQALRELAGQMGITVSPRGVELVDYFDDNLSFSNPALLDSEVPIHPSGAAVAYLEGDDLALPLAKAPKRSYSYNSQSEDDMEYLSSKPFTTGSGGVVTAALQTLEGSRFIWTGLPSEMLVGSMGEQLTSWAFQERGVLRLASKPTHHSLWDGQSHEIYRVGEPLKWCAEIEQWDGTEWSRVEPEDAQVEFRMLDPYWRLTLDSTGCAEFKAPDQHGMFSFLFDFKRPGTTFLFDKQVVTVRHMANDEWPRSWTITNSWVYLSSAFVIVAAFSVFVVVFLALPAPRAVTEDSASQVKQKPAATATATTVSETAAHISAPKKVKRTKK